MIPDAGRQTGGAGREALVVPAMGAPSRLTEAAEFRQVCKSVNLGAQAVEVAELGVGARARDASRYTFLCCWAEDSRARVVAWVFLSRSTCPEYCWEFLRESR